MLKTATGLGRSGLQDWLWQRVSAVIIGFYTLYVLQFWWLSSTHSYESWLSFFTSSFGKIFTLTTIVAIAVHAWIGMWTITTDYIKCLAIRLSAQLCIIFSLFFYIGWGIVILWH